MNATTSPEAAPQPLRANNGLQPRRLLVSVHLQTCSWAIKEADDVTERGSAENLENIRALQLNRDLAAVFIDASVRPQEVEEAAFEYGWYTFKGRAGQRNEISEAINQDNDLETEGMLFVNSFRFLSGIIHQTAVEKGWWDQQRNNGEILALIHSEVSEALEALRHGNSADDKIPSFCGAEAELADVVIRVMDLAEARGWRVGEALLAKVTHNQSRERMHGGKLF